MPGDVNCLFRQWSEVYLKHYRTRSARKKAFEDEVKVIENEYKRKTKLKAKKIVDIAVPG